MDSLSKFARQKLAEIKTKGLYRQTRPTVRTKAGGTARKDGNFISFCDNDYLGLNHHPDLIKAAEAASKKYGAGAGSSRLVTGDHPLNAELEAKIAGFKEGEAACIFGSGYLTNLGVIPVLAGRGDLIIADRLCHACLFAGSALAEASLKVFRHNDLDHLRDILEKSRNKAGNVLILTDGIFSMDGDRAPVEALSDLAREFDAWLMVDDAHGLGVVEDGHGASFKRGHRLDVPLQMGTFSKAVGSYGGYIVADAPVIDLIKNRARSLIYTTGLPPGVVAASLKGLEIIETNPALSKKPIQKAALFCTRLGLPAPQSSIVPLILGDLEATMAAASKLAAEGFLITPIRPPTVPDGTARLRFGFSASHKDEDILRLVDVIKGKRILP